MKLKPYFQLLDRNKNVYFLPCINHIYFNLNSFKYTFLFSWIRQIQTLYPGGWVFNRNGKFKVGLAATNLLQKAL